MPSTSKPLIISPTALSRSTNSAGVAVCAAILPACLLGRANLVERVHHRPRKQLAVPLNQEPGSFQLGDRDLHGPRVKRGKLTDDVGLIERHDDDGILVREQSVLVDR